MIKSEVRVQDSVEVDDIVQYYAPTKYFDDLLKYGEFLLDLKKS